MTKTERYMLDIAADEIFSLGEFMDIDERSIFIDNTMDYLANKKSDLVNSFPEAGLAGELLPGNGIYQIVAAIRYGNDDGVELMTNRLKYIYYAHNSKYIKCAVADWYVHPSSRGPIWTQEESDILNALGSTTMDVEGIFGLYGNMRVGPIISLNDMSVLKYGFSNGLSVTVLEAVSEYIGKPVLECINSYLITLDKKDVVDKLYESFYKLETKNNA